MCLFQGKSAVLRSRTWGLEEEDLASLSLSPDGEEGLFLGYGVGDPTPRCSQTGSPTDRSPSEKARRIDEDAADFNRA
jgi:hypothetical protein